MTNCRICQSDQTRALVSAREMMFGRRDTFAYFECSACGCLQIESIPDDMSVHYPAEYYSYAPAPRGGWLRFFLKAQHMRHAIGRFAPIGALLSKIYPAPDHFLLEISRHIALRNSMHVVDVGSGQGRRILNWRHAGFRKLTGVDPFVPEPIDYGNGVRVLKAAVTDVQLSADLVVAHHSFEHIAEQEATLRAISAMLKPAGYAVIAVPLWDSDAARHYGRDWVQLDAPRHFYLHTADSMRLLAGRVGLEVHEIVYNSSGFQFWGSEQIQRDIPLQSPTSYAVSPANSIFTSEQIAAFNRRADEANARCAGDQASFYLRKPG